MERKLDSYEIYFPNATHIKSPTLWDILGEHHKKTIAINIPQTYPAQPLNGVLISGFVALDLEKGVYPPALYPMLKEMDYRIDVDYREAAEKKEAFFEDIFYTLDKPSYKVRQVIKTSGAMSAGQLIARLNPILRGWANYHRPIVSKQTFVKVAAAIFKALWQWAKRRHPKKSRQWVKNRYFPALGRRAWTFAADTGRRTPAGQPVWVKLVYAGDTKIQRHIKIRKDANPFDSQWQPYFQDRAFDKKFGIRRRQAGIQPS